MSMELKVEKKMEENEVNEIVKEANKLTDDRIEASLNYDSLTQAEKDAIDEFNKKIDVTDSTQVLQFGSAAQNKISQFSDSVLDDVRTKNLGEVGDLLANLVGEIRSFNSAITLISILSLFIFNLDIINSEITLIKRQLILSYSPKGVIDLCSK